MKKLIIILVAVLLVLGVVVYLAAKYFFGGFTSAKLTYWGLWEPEIVYSTVIADYQKLHPNVTIEYKKQSQINYGDRLKVALADVNTTPDIFRFHNTWLPMLGGMMAPVPDSAYTSSSFKQTFYPVAQKDLYLPRTGKYYGIPLEIDTLALYVNREMLSSAGVSAPTVWPDEFAQTAARLTVYMSDGRIDRAGVAMGNAGNVTHWPDILGLAMVQNGVDVNNPIGENAPSVLTFYTGFQNSRRIWDGTMDEAKVAFAKGKLAMYFGYSWDYFDIKAINPNLQIDIFPAPQLADSNVNYASYWVEGVSAKSKNQTVAWDFLKFISSKEELTKLYEAQAKLRGYGEPYGRVDMADLLKNDPLVGVFVKQASSAKSGYLSGLTWDGDTGINTRINGYYAQAINSNNYGGDFTQAMTTVTSGVSQVLSSYGVSQR